MDRNKAIKTIIHQCDDEDGFLVQLRSWRRFQQDKYRFNRHQGISGCDSKRSNDREESGGQFADPHQSQDKLW